MTVFKLHLFFFLGGVLSVPIIRSSYSQKLIQGLGSVPTVFTNPSVLSTQDSIGYFYDPTTGSLIQTRRRAPGSVAVNASSSQNASPSNAQHLGFPSPHNQNFVSSGSLKPSGSSQSSHAADLSILRNIPEEALEKLQSEFPHFSRIDIANILSKDPQVVKALQEFSSTYKKTSPSKNEQPGNSETKKSDSTGAKRGGYFYPDLSSLS